MKITLKYNVNITTMIEVDNRTNALRDNYMSLGPKMKTKFRRKLSELCDWDSDATFYRKIKESYTPTPIEVIASNKVLEELPCN